MKAKQLVNTAISIRTITRRLPRISIKGEPNLFYQIFLCQVKYIEGGNVGHAAFLGIVLIGSNVLPPLFLSYIKYLPLF